jgi:hypothetical protein
VDWLTGRFLKHSQHSPQDELTGRDSQLRQLWPVTFAAVGLASGFLVWTLAAGLLPVRKPVTIVYSVQDASGKPIRQYRGFYRSDGADSQEQQTALGSRFRSILIVRLPREGVSMRLDPETHFVFTRRLAEDEAPRLRRRPTRTESVANCLKELTFVTYSKESTCEQTTQSILGYKVWRARAQIGPPGKLMTFESYLAPALDWHVLRQDQFDGDRLQGRAIAISVSQSEPPDEFFRAGTAAVAVTESDLNRHFREFRHLECTNCDSAPRRIRPGPEELIPPVY